VAGGELEGACPGHNFTVAPIPPTLRSRRLKLCTAVVDSLVCVAVFAGLDPRYQLSVQDTIVSPFLFGLGGGKDDRP